MLSNLKRALRREKGRTSFLISSLFRCGRLVLTFLRITQLPLPSPFTASRIEETNSRRVQITSISVLWPIQTARSPTSRYAFWHTELDMRELQLTSCDRKSSTQVIADTFSNENLSATMTMVTNCRTMEAKKRQTRMLLNSIRTRESDLKVRYPSDTARGTTDRV
jgi:hypothetical protein